MTASLFHTDLSDRDNFSGFVSFGIVVIVIITAAQLLVILYYQPSKPTVKRLLAKIILCSPLSFGVSTLQSF